jgi:hypothetical protein
MTPCREYAGYRDKRGYGRRSGRAERIYGTALVHRQVWILANGPIEPGLVVMHLCDNPACYRLDHLAVGTQKDNLHDMWRKGRGNNAQRRRTHCPQGHPYVGDNIDLSRQGWRRCRECNRRRARERARRYRAARRTA